MRNGCSCNLHRHTLAAQDSLIQIGFKESELYRADVLLMNFVSIPALSILQGLDILHQKFWLIERL